MYNRERDFHTWIRGQIVTDETEEAPYQGKPEDGFPESSLTTNEQLHEALERREKIARWNAAHSYRGGTDKYGELLPVTEIQVTCLHCGRFMGEMRSNQGEIVKLTHPALDDDRDDTPYYLDLSPLIASVRPDEIAATIGGWIRSIHREKKEVHIVNSFTDAEEIRIIHPEDLRQTEPKQHLRKILHPLLASHLEAIANILHLSESMGPMESWTLDMEPDEQCGFHAQFEIRVLDTGSCFTGETHAEETSTPPASGPDYYTSTNEPASSGESGEHSGLVGADDDEDSPESKDDGDDPGYPHVHES